jgi:hypothetical protein
MRSSLRQGRNQEAMANLNGAGVKGGMKLPDQLKR